MRFAVLGLAMAIVVAGCGKDSDSSSKDAGKKVGGAITNFAAGIGQGADASLLVNAELSGEFEKQGLSKTVAKSTALDGDGKGITIYFIANSPFKGTFIAKALNKEGMEIGRTATDVDFAADEAKYVDFKFVKETDMQLVDKFAIDIKK